MATKMEPGVTALPVDRVQQVMDHLAQKKPRPTPKGTTRQMLTLQVDRDVVAWFQSTGEDWQSRMNEALRKAAGL